VLSLQELNRPSTAATVAIDATRNAALSFEFVSFIFVDFSYFLYHAKLPFDCYPNITLKGRRC
jgi:hypothetical protein